MDELQRARERSMDGSAGTGEEEDFAAIASRLIADLDRSLGGDGTCSSSPDKDILVL
jgi:hypothetical protein